ncbi:MAG TPA: hypothetical protein VIU12_04770 [Chryseolinea sp.]
MYVFWAALFTAILYYFDYRKNHDISYFTNHSFLAWRTPLGLFVLIYLAIGLLIGGGYYFGIDIGLNKPLPEMVKQFFRDGTEPPVFVQHIVAGSILAYTTRILASSKAIPGYDGTIDGAVESLLKGEHDEKNIEDIRYEGKKNHIQKLLRQYRKNNNQAMDVNILVDRLRTYLKQTGTYNSPENAVLLEGLEKETNVETAFFTLATAGFPKRRLQLLIK